MKKIKHFVLTVAIPGTILAEVFHIIVFRSL